jgi:hypothetical protein
VPPEGDNRFVNGSLSSGIVARRGGKTELVHRLHQCDEVCIVSNVENFQLRCRNGEWEIRQIGRDDVDRLRYQTLAQNAEINPFKIYNACVRPKTPE